MPELQLTYRLEKGSKLTAQEGDDNFRFLNQRAEVNNTNLDTERTRIDAIYVEKYTVEIPQSQFANLADPTIISESELGTGPGRALKMHPHLTEVYVETSAPISGSGSFYIDDLIHNQNYISFETTVFTGISGARKMYLPNCSFSTDPLLLTTENGIQFYSDGPISCADINAKIIISFFYQIVSPYNDII